MTALTTHPCDAAKVLISRVRKVLGAEKTRCEGVLRRWLLERGLGRNQWGPSPIMAPKLQLLSWNKELVQLPSAYGT